MDIPYSTEDLCCICREPYDESTGHDAFRLNCQHAFGRSCINTWARVSIICPVCCLDTFPAELSGWQTSFRALADRTIFVPDPPESTVRSGVMGGLVGVAACFACAVSMVNANTVSPILEAGAAICIPVSVLFASIGLLRGIGLGNDAQSSISYCLTVSACLFLSSFFF